MADVRPVQAEAERKHDIEDSEAHELRGRLPRPASCVADFKAIEREYGPWGSWGVGVGVFGQPARTGT